MIDSTDTSPTASFKSVETSRELLFGEIDSSGTRSLRTNASLCNLTFSSNSKFLKFWLSDRTRNLFLSHVDDKQDLARLRLVCHDFSAKVAPYLFDNVCATFRTSTFTKPSRVAALERIGHHIKTFRLNVPHTIETFLPPLIHPQTGEETSFIYVPQVHAPKTLLDKAKQPKYGSWEITDLLIRQYPTIFHAATNVPAFVKAFSALQNLEHLILSCPRQAPPERTRASIVDYVLISIRIAIELAPMLQLKQLSLLPIHPSGLFYLQPVLAFGSSPKSLKRWAQIETITIHVENDVQACGREQNLIKLLHTYLRNFTSSLTKLNFRWDGRRGPCPLPLLDDAEITTTATCTAFNCYSSSSSGGGGGGKRRGLRFRKLREMELRNAVMDSAQVSAFIAEHGKTLTQFSFEDVKLRTGTWDEALSPLSHMTNNKNNTKNNDSSRGREWEAAEMKMKKTQPIVEIMEVPIMLSAENLRATRVFETLGGGGGTGDVCCFPTSPSPTADKPLPDTDPPTLCRWLAKARAHRALSKKAKRQQPSLQSPHTCYYPHAAPRLCYPSDYGANYYYTRDEKANRGGVAATTTAGTGCVVKNLFLKGSGLASWR